MTPSFSAATPESGAASSRACEVCRLDSQFEMKLTQLESETYFSSSIKVIDLTKDLAARKHHENPHVRLNISSDYPCC